MNILLTGAGGFVGAYLVERLRHRHHVWTIERRGSPVVNRIGADLTQSDACVSAVRSALEGTSIDVLIHLAARTATPETAEDLSILLDNVRMTETAVRLVRDRKIRKLIAFSSASVYPNVTGTFDERSLVAPQHNSDCVYGLSKFCAEVLFESLLSRDCPVRTHLRVAQIWGDAMPANRLPPTMVRELREQGTVTVFGDGERTVNFVTLERLTDIVDECVTQDRPGTFNVSQYCVSVRDLANQVIACGGETGRLVSIPQGNRHQFRLGTVASGSPAAWCTAQAPPPWERDPFASSGEPQEVAS